MIHASLNLTTAPGHDVLAAAGKTVLRPGGRAATEQLFKWANFKPGETVLELASGLGTTAIALAKRYDVRVIGIEKNPDRVALAQANVRSAGLEDQVQIIVGNVFQLETIAEQFDVVLAEAILTMQSPAGKAKILAGVYDRLKPGGRFISQELLARDHIEQLHQDLAQAIRVNATPLLEPDWISAFNQAGLAIVHHKTGTMKLLDPMQMLQDEGPVHTMQILWNVLTQPVLRDRLLAMRQVFAQHRQDMGYIALLAVRES